jgi:hypothetical protein
MPEKKNINFNNTECNPTYYTNIQGSKSLSKFNNSINLKKKNNVIKYTMDKLNSKFKQIKYGYIDLETKHRINPSNNKNWEDLINIQYNNEYNLYNYIKFYKYFIKDTNIIVLDFDNHDNNGLNLSKIFDKFPFLENTFYTISKSGKGFHFYVSSEEEKYQNITKEIKCNKERN